MVRSIALGCAALLGSWVCIVPAQAAPMGVSRIATPSLELLEVQGAYNSKPFRRCMRAKYGPRYFARVPRAHRWHMSQACLA